MHFYKLALVVRFRLVDRFCLLRRSFYQDPHPSIRAVAEQEGLERKGKEIKGKGKGRPSWIAFRNTSCLAHQYAERLFMRGIPYMWEDKVPEK